MNKIRTLQVECVQFKCGCKIGRSEEITHFFDYDLSKKSQVNNNIEYAHMHG